jgi:hypothetical protein
MKEIQDRNRPARVLCTLLTCSQRGEYGRCYISEFAQCDKFFEKGEKICVKAEAGFAPNTTTVRIARS